MSGRNRARGTAYLCGLFTADGCFTIVRNGPGRLLPAARILLRADDGPLLGEIHRRTGIGRLLINERVHTGKKSPEASWSVRSARDLEVLVSLFDRDIPRGRKRREYEIWREAVACYQAGGGTARRPISLRRMLTEARRYPPLTAREAS